MNITPALKRLPLLLCGMVALFMHLTALADDIYNETGWLPTKGDKLVYDYCSILTTEQTNLLEQRLLDFNDSTSNQIVVIMTPGFGGNDIAAFAQEVGDAWGIGQKSLNNGVVIVIKPKDETDGQVYIATGYGLEGALPDIFCKSIINDIMIPHFREDDYYGAVDAALDVILPVCAGEYSYDQYCEDNELPLWGLVVGIGIFVLFIYICYKLDKGGGGSGYSGGGTYYGGNTRVSGWGGSYGGSSGGFGGFGGGSFGGGGAGGRW